MVKKIYNFGLLAAALMIIAPTAALAESQSRQEINQNATAIGSGSRVNQRVDQRSSQQRTTIGNTNSGRCRSGASQRSTQIANQDGVAIDNSRVDQRIDQDNNQRQIRSSRRYCY